MYALIPVVGIILGMHEQVTRAAGALRLLYASRRSGFEHTIPSYLLMLWIELAALDRSFTFSMLRPHGILLLPALCIRSSMLSPSERSCFAIINNANEFADSHIWDLTYVSLAAVHVEPISALCSRPSTELRRIEDMV